MFFWRPKFLDVKFGVASMASFVHVKATFCCPEITQLSALCALHALDGDNPAL